MIGQTAIAAIRFGYGLPLPAGAPTTAAATLAPLARPDAMAQVWPIEGLAQLLPKWQRLGAEHRASKTAGAPTPGFVAAEAEILDLPLRALRATFARALDSADGFRERLVAFWANHFTVTRKQKYQGMMPFALVEDAIRPNLAAHFSDLLTAVTLHPAMLVYLDQTASVGPNSAMGRKRGHGLNENLARELIELHSLGVEAGYAQADVRQMAELLTGLMVREGEGTVFDRRRAEPGPELVLGKSYDGTGFAPIRAALADLAARPETARHLARKLAVHFVADDPDPALVDALARVWAETGGDLLAVYGTLLAHPAALAPPLRKVRQPYDFLVAALRALGVDGAAVMALDGQGLKATIQRPLRAMGQPFQMAKGPDGWPEAAADWITPQGLAQRINWAMQMPKRLVRPLPAPAAFLATALADQAGPDLVWAVARAENAQEALGLVLASADFNRR